MENNTAAKMIEDMQEKFPGLTPEVAAQTILVESLPSVSRSSICLACLLTHGSSVAT